VTYEGVAMMQERILFLAVQSTTHSASKSLASTTLSQLVMSVLSNDCIRPQLPLQPLARARRDRGREDWHTQQVTGDR
jgi:hypothetical protein